MVLYLRGFPWVKKYKFHIKQNGSVEHELAVYNRWSSFHLTSTQHFRSGCTQNSTADWRERIAELLCTLKYHLATFITFPCRISARLVFL